MEVTGVVTALTSLLPLLSYAKDLGTDLLCSFDCSSAKYYQVSTARAYTKDLRKFRITVTKDLRKFRNTVEEEYQRVNWVLSSPEAGGHHPKTLTLRLRNLASRISLDEIPVRDSSGPSSRLSASSRRPWRITRYFIEGRADGISVEALADTGADMCIISEHLASRLALSPIRETHRSIALPNGARVQSPGMVKVPWKFSGEKETYPLDCWILPGCVHDLILAGPFLKVTRTTTKYRSRIRSKLVELPNKLRLQLLRDLKGSELVWGYLNGRFTTASPDTGSDIMAISRAYAEELELAIESVPGEELEIEYADGSTGWTSGVVRNASWRIDTKEIHCDFHVLDDLCVDVVLNNDYLFNSNVFSECPNKFFDAGLEPDYEFDKLCNIRLIGRHGKQLGNLEDEYLQDCKKISYPLKHHDANI